MNMNQFKQYLFDFFFFYRYTKYLIIISIFVYCFVIFILIGDLFEWFNVIISNILDYFSGNFQIECQGDDDPPCTERGLAVHSIWQDLNTIKNNSTV